MLVRTAKDMLFRLAITLALALMIFAALMLFAVPILAPIEQNDAPVIMPDERPTPSELVARARPGAGVARL